VGQERGSGPTSAPMKRGKGGYGGPTDTRRGEDGGGTKDRGDCSSEGAPRYRFHEIGGRVGK